MLAEWNVDAVAYAHASAGCLHVRPFLDLREPQQVEALEAVARGSARLARKYGGVIASEHGDGRARGALAEDFYTPAPVRGLPGHQARVRPARPAQPRQDRRRAAADRGAADGARLPLALGRDGDDVPRRPGPRRRVRRGRRGVQRLGRLPQDRRGDDVPAVHGDARGEGLDARPGATRSARRSRAASVADRARGGGGARPVRLVQGVQGRVPGVGRHGGAQDGRGRSRSTRRTRPSARTRLFAHMPVVARRVAGPLAAVANRVNALPPARAALARLGVAPERALPPFATRPFTSAEAGRPGADAGRPARRALRRHVRALPGAVDPARRARRCSQAAGAQRRGPRVPLLRADVPVEGVRAAGERLARGWSRPTRRSRGRASTIVGLEPSCILTLRDEIPRLVPGEDAAGRRGGGRHLRGVVRRPRRPPGRARLADAGRRLRRGARPRALPPEGAVADVGQPRRAWARPGCR